VAAYHEASLGELIEHVAQTIERFRAGELDAFAADHALFHHSRSAKELWKFCTLTPAEIAVRAIVDQPAVNWWERGAPRRP
jgi:hypothetical protein